MKSEPQKLFPSFWPLSGSLGSPRFTSSHIVGYNKSLNWWYIQNGGPKCRVMHSYVSLLCPSRSSGNPLCRSAPKPPYPPRGRTPLLSEEKSHHSRLCIPPCFSGWRRLLESHIYPLPWADQDAVSWGPAPFQGWSPLLIQKRREVPARPSPAVPRLPWPSERWKVGIFRACLKTLLFSSASERVQMYKRLRVSGEGGIFLAVTWLMFAVM